MSEAFVKTLKRDYVRISALPDAETALRTLSANIARSQYQRLSWKQQPNEPEDDTKLRSLIISLMIYGEDADAIKAARDLYSTTPIESLDKRLSLISH